MDRPRNWARLVNKPLTQREVERIRTGIARNRPYGDDQRQDQQAKQLGLIDRLGNLEDAIEWAGREGGIKEKFQRSIHGRKNFR